MSLLGAFKLLSGCEIEMAKVIFYSIDSFQGRKSLLNRVVGAVGDGTDKTLVKAIIDAAQKSNDQRQHVSHAILAHVGPTFNELRLLRPKSNTKVPVTKEYMGDLMKNSWEALSASQKALQTLLAKRVVPEKPKPR
jgi:hypothetical protein